MSNYKEQRKCGKYYAPDPDKPDEDIITESIHPLYLNIEELLANSKKTRRYKRLKRNKIPEIKKPPRPQNRFILYKKNMLNSPEYKKKSKKDRKVKFTSKEIGIRWGNETEEVIKFFCAL